MIEKQELEGNSKEIAYSKGYNQAIDDLKADIERDDSEERLEAILNDTRMFWVVDSVDENREIFLTREEAEKFANPMDKVCDYTIMLSNVNNWYEEDGSYNYDDYSDTFDDIMTFTTNTKPKE